MLYIDNLSELIIGNYASSVFLLQDDVVQDTVEIIRHIRSVYGKETHYSKLLGFDVKMLVRMPLVNKACGRIQYDMKALDSFDFQYQLVSFVKRYGIDI